MPEAIHEAVFPDKKSHRALLDFAYFFLGKNPFPSPWFPPGTLGRNPIEWCLNMTSLVWKFEPLTFCDSKYTPPLRSYTRLKAKYEVHLFMYAGGSPCMTNVAILGKEYGVAEIDLL
jgi:hypothetical protein